MQCKALYSFQGPIYYSIASFIYVYRSIYVIHWQRKDINTGRLITAKLSNVIHCLQSLNHNSQNNCFMETKYSKKQLSQIIWHPRIFGIPTPNSL